MPTPSTFLPSSRLSQMTEYFFALAGEKIAEQQKKGVKVVNLGMGSPDLSPSEKVIDALSQKIHDPTLHKYPNYYGLPELKSAIGEWYTREYSVSVDPQKMILPLAGSKEGIVFLTMAMIGEGDQVLLPNPGYSSYKRAVMIAGGEAVEYELSEKNGYLPNIDELEKRDLSRVKMMWINYPNNPTGAVANLAQLTEIVEFAKKHHILIASDAPYSHLTFEGSKAPSVLQVPGAMEVAVELNSFSKTYNMAGWRLGWAVGNLEAISYLTNLYSNIETGVFLPIQYAAIEALNTPQSWIDQRNAVYAERRAEVLKILAALNCTPYLVSATLYVWAKLPSEVTNAEQFCFDLLEKTGVFVAPGTAFGSAGEGYVRASICQPVELLREAVERVK